MEYEKLIKAAIKARGNAYAPYSRFKVGAAVIMEDNKIYCGCNIENASYAATICAERTAICNGASKGNRYVKAIAIAGPSDEYTYPCGICRQVIIEFSNYDDIDVIIIKNEKEYKIEKIKDLLPNAFIKNRLE